MKNWTEEKLKSGAIFLIDKPLDWTSFDVVKKLKYNLKHQLGIKKLKVGHAGTLDPRATGLLVVCVGKATKQISTIQQQEKVYTGIIKLGVQTPSYDTESEEINPMDFSHLNETNIREIIPSFMGDIEQTPPAFSAIKKNGVRAYDMARKGELVTLSPRQISIYELQFSTIDLPWVHFQVRCSKGTYIRSLAHDIGNALGVGAYLYTLRRESIGSYQVENAQNEILFEPNFFVEN